MRFPCEVGAPEHFLVGYAGRLAPEKGVDLLIQALEMLPGRFRLTPCAWHRPRTTMR